MQPRDAVATARDAATPLPRGARAASQTASGGRQSLQTLTPRAKAALTRKVRAHPLKASAATFTPAVAPWAAPPFHPPLVFPFSANPGIMPGSLDQVATGVARHRAHSGVADRPCQAAPHWQQPADSTGMTVILDGSDEFAVTEGYYPAGLFVPGPVYLAQSVTYKRLAGPCVPAAPMMPHFPQGVSVSTAGHQGEDEHHGQKAQQSQKLQQPRQEPDGKEQRTSSALPHGVLLEGAQPREEEAPASAAAPVAAAEAAAQRTVASDDPKLQLEVEHLRHNISEHAHSSPTQTDAESSQTSENGGFTEVLKGAARTPLAPARTGTSVWVANMFGDLALSESDGGSSSVQSVRSRKRKSGTAGTSPHVRFESLSPERTSRRPRSEHFERATDDDNRGAGGSAITTLSKHRSKLRAAGVRQVQIAGAKHPERREDDAKKRRERSLARRRKRRLSTASSNSDHDASYILHQTTYTEDADGNDSDSGVSCVSRLTGPMSEYSGGLSFGSDVSVSELNSRASSFSVRSVTSDSVVDVTDADDDEYLDGPAPAPTAKSVGVAEYTALPSKQTTGDQKRERRPTSILQRAAEKAAAGECGEEKPSKTVSAEREWFANWLDASRRCASPRGRSTRIGESEQDVAMDGATADDCITPDILSENARAPDEGEHEQDETLVPPLVPPLAPHPKERPPATRERIIAGKVADYVNTEFFLNDGTQVEGETADQNLFAVAAPDDLGSKHRWTKMKINLPVKSCKMSSDTKWNQGEESGDESEKVRVAELRFEEPTDHLLKFVKSEKGEAYIQTQLLAKMLRIDVEVDAEASPDAEAVATPETCDGVESTTIDVGGAVHMHLTLIDDATPANLAARIQEFDADTVSTRPTNNANENTFVGSVRNACLFEQAVNERVPISTTSQQEELKRAVVLLNRQNEFQCEVRAAERSAREHLATHGLVDVNDEAWWGDKLARMKDILMMLSQRRQQHIDSLECERRITRNTNAQVDPLFELAHIYASKKEKIEANLRALHSKSSTDPEPGKAGLQQNRRDSVASRGKAMMVVPASNAQQMKYVPRVAAYWYLLRSFLNLHLRQAAVERDLFINHLPSRFYTTTFGTSNLRPSVTEFAAVTAPVLCAKLQDALDAKLKSGQAGTREAQQLAMILKEATDLYIVARAKLHDNTEPAMANQSPDSLGLSKLSARARTRRPLPW